MIDGHMDPLFFSIRAIFLAFGQRSRWIFRTGTPKFRRPLRVRKENQLAPLGVAQIDDRCIPLLRFSLEAHGLRVCRNVKRRGRRHHETSFTLALLCSIVVPLLTNKLLEYLLITDLCLPINERIKQTCASVFGPLSTG